MPSRRVNEPRVVIRQFEVVGADGQAPGFIRHTGLASDTGEHDRGNVPVVDMAPPMRLTGPMKADAIGAAVLTDDESRKIKDFVDRHDGEHKAAQKLSRATFQEAYCIFPHATPFNEVDGRYVRMRFSCSGFVFEAYKRARIELVDLAQLPHVTLDKISLAYTDYSAFLERLEFREKVGLQGDGPWPVLLCGYLLNALNRDEMSIRQQKHIVQAGDEHYV